MTDGPRPLDGDRAPDPDAAVHPDPVSEFFRSLNEADVGRLARALHQDFEVVVPLKPARGFKGRDQEVRNMAALFDAHRDLSVRILRRADAGNEVWTETVATASGLEMAAVIIWTIDDATRTLIRGRYYSDIVEPDAAPMDDFIRSITAVSGDPATP